ncbi:MAG: hypothetical protein D6731_04025 [Planctomycetota bacterium]|nr:MAG: hypothetical protein D6731_04025 [Planctomycetota bacterium]
MVLPPPQAGERSPVARTRVSGCRLLERRSRGPLGELHLAETEEGRAVLVRLVAQGLAAEALEPVEEALASLEDLYSPNVARVLGRDLRGDPGHYLLEDPGGASLLDLVRRCRPLDAAELVWLGRGLASGLSALHRRNLPHGGLAPASVAVCAEGPRIVDLGWKDRLAGRGPEKAGDLRALGELLVFAASGVRPPPPGKPFDLRKRVPWLPPPVAHLLEELLGPAEARPSARETTQRFEELAPQLSVPERAPLPSLLPLLDRVTDRSRDPGTRSDGNSGLRESSWDLDGPALEPGSAVLLRPGLELNVERLLGRGGMGVVYLVRDAQLGRLAALKLVRGRNETRVRRFQRETGVTARLDHPGIPSVYEAGRTPAGEDYLLMRYVEGSSLRQLLDRREQQGGSRSREEVRRLLAALVRVGEALGYAHSRGIVHRDLKPDNIMVGAHAEVFVMDWGLARNLGESAQEDARLAQDLGASGPAEAGARGERLTRDGAFLGTPGYVAPEQFRCEEVDGRADVFALGAVLTEVLTGRPPFASDDSVEVLAATNEGRIELPAQRDPRVAPELNAIAAKALAADKAYRYTSVEGMVADLRAYLEGREVSVYRRSPSAQLFRLLRRHAVFFSFQGLVLLLLVAAGVWVTKANTEAAAARRAFAERESDRSAQARADRARRRVEVNGLVAAGKRALEGGDAELAKEYFVKALALDPEHLDARQGKREAEAVLERRRAEAFDRGRAEQASRLVAQARSAEARGDLEEARRALVQALGFDGSHAEAREGLLRVDRALRERERAKAQAARKRRADLLVRRARRRVKECHELVRRQEDPRKIQDGYLAALDDLERALRLLRKDEEVERLRVRAAQELYTVLSTEGQEELAEFVLQREGVERPPAGAVKLERDPTLVVEETDAVLVRRAFPGAVHFLPTRAFDGLRDYLARLGKGRFRALIGVRSRVTDSVPPNVLAVGLWIRLEDRKTRSITPTLKLEFERPFRRGIRLDRHRRLVAPFDRSSPLEAKPYVKQAEDAIKRLVREAVNRKR